MCSLIGCNYNECISEKLRNTCKMDDDLEEMRKLRGDYWYLLIGI